ncbi:MAG TPA: efflux RND transporter periplasmic adaptor subunit [Methylomirabilota bacterium]|nr:efflux RND transporter periplasmic adaptor subunit [Methylomirabilota bacterium]
MDAERLNALQIAPTAKQRSRRSLWGLLVLIALATGTAVYLAWPRAGDDRRVFTRGGSDPASPSNAPAPPGPAQSAGATPASADTALTSNVVLTVSGYIINRERIELSPRFMGQVKWIGVRKGDSVTNGQVVVLLDDAEARARVAETEGRLASARVAVAKAELAYERVRRLIADRIETQEAEDNARLALEAARATVREIEGQLALAQTYLEWTVIRSPIDGVVLEKLVDAGELVTPQSFGGTRGPSTALIAIADPKDLQVEIDLNEADLAKVSLKQNCRVSPEAYPDRAYAGYVAEIAPEANRQKGTLQVKVQVLNPDRYLTPELSARVDFLSTIK